MVLGERAASPLPPARGPGERCKLTQWGLGQGTGWNGFLCVFNPTETTYLSSLTAFDGKNSGEARSLHRVPASPKF